MQGQKKVIKTDLINITINKTGYGYVFDSDSDDELCINTKDNDMFIKNGPYILQYEDSDDEGDIMNDNDDSDDDIN